MTLIYGFDPSKHTGFAIVNTTRHLSSIKCGVLELPEECDHYYAADQIGLKVKRLVLETGKPDFVILEHQIAANVSMTDQHGNKRQSSADAMIYPWLATSAIVATLANFGIPYGSISASHWRTSFFGKGFKPTVGKDGKNAWKDAAVSKCQEFEIVLPRLKAVAHNAAEACGIALSWRSKEMKLHNERYHAPWMALIQNAR